ncbi:hypothetical protein V2J09_009053 [Rumex salicifolius]
MAMATLLMHVLLYLLTAAATLCDQGSGDNKYPMVVSTWPFVEAVRAAWTSAADGSPALDSVVDGCSACEDLRCDGTVGPGGSPDEYGETTLDALVMNGETMEVGAVAAMRYVKDGIRAARLVMQHTDHTLLVGERASEFAISMGLSGPTDLSSTDSLKKWIRWKQDGCQPNFWKDVLPTNSCGPYIPKNSNGKCLAHILENTSSASSLINVHNHDTIAMAVYDKMGHVAVGTSTNGATFKIPGRVGDGPIAGSSAYADGEVGACGATGDDGLGWSILWYVRTHSYQVVESMRAGMHPKLAAEDAMSRIARKFPKFVGAVFAVNKEGVHAGACHGWTFQYSVRTPQMDDVQVYTVSPLNSIPLSTSSSNH